MFDNLSTFAVRDATETISFSTVPGISRHDGQFHIPTDLLSFTQVVWCHRMHRQQRIISGLFFVFFVTVQPGMQQSADSAMVKACVCWSTQPMVRSDLEEKNSPAQKEGDKMAANSYSEKLGSARLETGHLEGLRQQSNPGSSHDGLYSEIRITVAW
jgi:hypothetical protein